MMEDSAAMTGGHVGQTDGGKWRRRIRFSQGETDSTQTQNL